MFGICIDKRVIGGLAIAGVGVLILAPQLMIAALPILLIAICPLSMLLMGKAMMSGSLRMGAPAPESIEAAYRAVPSLDRDQEVAVLHAQLQAMSDQQAMLADQLAQLQTGPRPTSIGADGTEGALPSPDAQR